MTFNHRPVRMDILISNYDHDHHTSQKDFLGSLFQQPPAMQQDHNHHHQGSMSFQSSQGGPPPPQATNVPLSPGANLQNQLTMNMLNNMLQIQHVGDQLTGITAQQTSGGGPANVQYNSQAVFEQQFKLSQLQQLQQLQNQIFQHQIALISGQSFVSTSPPIGGHGAHSNALPLSSMKDQNSSSTPHGDTVSSFSGLPTPGSSQLRARDNEVEFVSPMILNNSFLDSPISPQTSHHPNDHPFHPHQRDSHGHSQHFHPHPHTAPPQIAFNIRSGIHSNPTSPDFNGADAPPSSTLSSVSGMHSNGELDVDISPLTSPWLGAAGDHHHRQHHQLPSGVDSGLNIQNTPPTGFAHHNRSGMSSSLRSKRPAEGDGGNNSNDQPSSGHAFDTSEPLRKKHILHTPSMSGLNHPSQHSHQQLTLLPPPSHSPITSPISPSNQSSSSPPTFSSASQRRIHRVSKSVSNTPLIRAQRGRMNSVTRNQTNANANSNSNSGTTPLVLPPHGMGGRGGSSSLTNTPSMTAMGSGTNMAMMVVGDTPSPVDLDLSMPPPAPPDHANSGPNTPLMNSSPNLQPCLNGGMGYGDERRLLPATPASMMNLIPLNTGPGGRPRQQQSHNVLGAAGTIGKDQQGPEMEKEGIEKAKGAEKEMDGKGKGQGSGGSGTGTTRRGTRRSTAAAAGATGGALGASPGLKAILPANILNLNSPPLHLPPGSSSRIDQQVNPQQPRKTSHKAAEQKRRDSLKSTFDDLRTLLPPIPLSSEMDDGVNSGGVIPGIPGAWPPRSSSLLPGSLPPRGPPKTGADGPNKGVSKLQLLICGNEYLRVLRSRVERRDEEIARLRNEVVKLRGLVQDMKLSGGAGGDVDMLDANSVFDLDLDLERDLDAVEFQPRDGGGVNGLLGSAGMGGPGMGAMSLGLNVSALGSVGEQPDEEDDGNTGD